MLGFGLRLGLKTKIFGLGRGIETQVLGLGLVPCGFVNIPVCFKIIVIPDQLETEKFDSDVGYIGLP